MYRDLNLTLTILAILYLGLRVTRNRPLLSARAFLVRFIFIHDSYLAVSPASNTRCSCFGRVNRSTAEIRLYIFVVRDVLLYLNIDIESGVNFLIPCFTAILLVIRFTAFSHELRLPVSLDCNPIGNSSVAPVLPYCDVRSVSTFACLRFTWMLTRFSSVFHHLVGMSRICQPPSVRFPSPKFLRSRRIIAASRVSLSVGSRTRILSFRVYSNSGIKRPITCEQNNITSGVRIAKI